MNRLYLDTHVLVWLYQDGAARLTPTGGEAIRNAEQLLISPMAELELGYLHEIARITVPAEVILDCLRRDMGLVTCTLPFSTVVGHALLLNWTRDPFDRIIVAQAACRDSHLLSSDRNIQAHYDKAFW